MVYIRQGVLVFAVAFIPLLLCATSNGPIFFPDDPILKMPPPVAVGKPYVHKINQPFDFVKNSVRYRARPPDSAWFTNRHVSHRMSREELQRGPAQGEPPTAPFIVVGGKAEGISPGFRMEDAKHRTYFVKVDPPDNPEMATAADVIVSRFLFALGYNVPENDIVIAKFRDFKVSGKAELTTGRRKRKMTNDDFRDIVRRIPHYSDGSFRLMASRKIDGEAIGPFYYEDIRADDPNDTVRHENRRDLRGLFVLFSWLNNTDARAGNTYDAVLEENGVRFIKHYLLDFGSALGSDGDSPKDPRLGHEFMIATPHEAMHSILTLGLVPNKWERTDYGKLPAVGKFSAQAFEPADWKSDYPNQAFLSRLPDDDYWAAKQVMAFTDDDIRTIVETGQFSDTHVVDYLTATLAARRDKIGKAFFSKVQPLDNFRVENDEIRFDDLAGQYNFRAPQNYEVYWAEFDNMTGRRTRIPGEPSSHLPAMAKDAAVGSYFLAVISSPHDTLQPVMVAVVKTAEGYRVVGSSRYEVRPKA